MLYCMKLFVKSPLYGFVYIQISVLCSCEMDEAQFDTHNSVFSYTKWCS